MVTPRQDGSGAVCCPFCELPCHPQFLLCPRCGGGLRPEPPLEALLALLQHLRVLLRNRVWHGVNEALKQIQQRLMDEPAMRPSLEPSLGWLGQDLEGAILGASGADCARLLRLAKGVLPLLPANAFPRLRTRVSGLGTLFDLLTAVEKQCRERGTPAADKVQSWFRTLLVSLVGKFFPNLSVNKVQSWFRTLLGKAGVATDEAHACVYASPERWPTLAAWHSTPRRTSKQLGRWQQGGANTR